MDNAVGGQIYDGKSINIAASPTKEKGTWTKPEKKVWVTTLFAGTTVLFSSRIAMPVCATAMAKEFGWNKEDLGTVMGCFFWGYAVTQIFGGYMSDRFGGDRVLCLAAVAWGSVTFITPHVAYLYDDRHVTLLLLGLFRVFLGLSQGVHFPSMTSLLSHNVRERDRSFAMGVASAGSNFGTLLCGGIGSVILEHRGWPDVFHFIGLSAMFWAAHTWQLSKQQQQKQNAIEEKPHEAGEKVPWKLIFSKVPFWSTVFTHCSFGIMASVWLFWMPTYFEDNFPGVKGWVFNVVPWLVSIPSSTFGGWLSGRIIRANYSVTFTRKLIQSIAMVGSGFFALLMPFCTNFNAALFAAAASLSLQTFHNSAVLVNPQDIAPAYAGSVFGIMNTAGAVPGFLGVYIAGYILNATGSWKTVFFSVFVTNVVGATVFIVGGTAEKIIM